MVKKKVLGQWLLGLAGIYVGVVILMMFMETSLIYPAPKRTDLERDTLRSSPQHVRFESADGTELSGLWCEPKTPEQTILFFHGNGEDLLSFQDSVRFWSRELNASIFAFDYRGYGASLGTPSEEKLIADGIAAVEWLRDHKQIPTDQIVFLGRSLGGGVALQVAKTYPPRVLLLFSTFSSLVDVAANSYPWLPVRWVIRNRFLSLSAMVDFQIPLLQLHGTRDRLIPIEMGKKLFEASPATLKQFVPIEGAGHNNLPIAEHLKTIKSFLDSLDP